MKTFISDLSKKEFPISQKVVARNIRTSILDLILKDNPDFTENNTLSVSELNVYRENYIQKYLTEQIGELHESEHKVLNSLIDHKSILKKIKKEEKQKTTYGQKIADKVAKFGGSWTFIISFAVFLFIWISLNAFWLANKGFDPYPFILLNLILSCIAAMQAPVIMMSQNRQEEKDRSRSKKDYMINLKSEIEIRMLHEKIDHLIMHQQQELLEIQKVQIEMMNDILEQVETKK